jgi:hypothetical protein
MTHRRPAPSEYDSFYGSYVSLVPDGDIIDTLREQRVGIGDLIAAIPAEKTDYRYAPGKWTTREVVGHVIDAEWVFTSRALWFARGVPTPLPGMDQDEFMSGANFADRDLSGLAQEFAGLRSAGIVLFDSFDEDIMSRVGVASGTEVTVRALAYIIAGHALHHVRVLEERYL